MEVERIDCEPHKVVREVVKVLTARAREKGVSLAFEAATALPEKIQSDPGRLRQIVTNLVGNALKFTEKGGVRVVARIAGTRAAPQLALLRGWFEARSLPWLVSRLTTAATASAGFEVARVVVPGLVPAAANRGALPHRTMEWSAT